MKNNFLETIEKYPQLTTHGFGVDDNTYSLQSEREELKKYEEAFRVSCDMLKQSFANHKTRRIHSYSLKHIAERSTRNVYVPEGALIAAVLYLGLPYKRDPKSTGIYVYVKELSKIN